MGLITPKSNKLDYFIRRVATEMSTTFLTVHDEIDYATDRSILFPLAKRFSLLLDISKYYAKYKVPYIRYLFDVEYDDWGAWTASKSIKVYSSPISREENMALLEYKEAIKYAEANKVDEVEVEQEETEVTINLVELKWTPEVLISELEKLPQGNTTLKVKQDSSSKSLNFYKKLELASLKELLKRCSKLENQ